MGSDIMIAGIPLTEATVVKLEEVLDKDNPEPLKKLMNKLYGYKNMYDMHDDHIIDLAWFIVDLWRSEDRVKWASDQETYIRPRMNGLRDAKRKKRHEKQWAAVTKTANELTALDLAYQLWVYELGYEHSHYQMLMKMHKIVQDILGSWKRGIL